MHMRLRTALAALVVSLLAAAAGLVGASPAQVDPPNGCTGGFICFYVNVNDNVPSTAYHGSITRNQCRTVSPNNSTSYIVNFTSVRWYVYTVDGANCHSSEETSPGIIYPLSQGQMSAQFNDRISYTLRTSQTSKAGPYVSAVDPTLVRPVG